MMDNKIKTVWLVVLQDKELAGEPDVGFAIVSDVDSFVGELRANRVGRLMEEDLRIRGRCRCVATVRPIEPDRGYNINAMFNRGNAR